jgi:pimeloyl-ACP methyl ester carboxylesterase
MDAVKVDGLRITYERAGRGPVVAFAHGFVGDGPSTWSGQMEALADDFTVIAWDAPGAGGSSEPPAWFRVEHYADCFAGFLHALGIGRAHVVGLSFGGVLALAAVDRHPALVRSIALVSAYAGWAGSLAPGDVEQRLQACLGFARLSPDEFVDAMAPSMFSDRAPRPAVERFAAVMRSTFSPAGFIAMTRASAEADLRDMLGDVAVPTLLLYGDQDVRAPVAVGEAIRDAVPGVRLVVIPGAGHVSSVETPGRVAAELKEFLTSQPADLDVGDSAGDQ